MKVVSTDALTKLIQLVKSAFISVDDTEQTSEVTLATVATTGDYDDLTNKPNIYHQDLLSFQWSDHLLNNVSWLRADTFSWQDGSVYEAAYEHLVDDIDGKTTTTETVAGITITYYLADDGHKIVPAANISAVESLYAATGVAWYYVIDTVNEKFKLPRTKWGVVGLRGNVGDYVPESLPNIKGGITSDQSNIAYNGDTGTGALYTVEGSSFVGTSNGGNRSCGVFLDASRSSSTYQDDAPVQQRATQMYLYFYVGSFTQTALENTAGLNAELFNEKIDLDLGNATQATKETIVGWSMPDYSAGVAKTWNTDITTTQNVRVCYGGASQNTPANSIRLYINNNLVGNYIIANAGVFMQWVDIPAGVTYKVTGGQFGQYITEYPFLGE